MAQSHDSLCPMVSPDGHIMTSWSMHHTRLSTKDHRSASGRRFGRYSWAVTINPRSRSLLPVPIQQCGTGCMVGPVAAPTFWTGTKRWPRDRLRTLERHTFRSEAWRDVDAMRSAKGANRLGSGFESLTAHQIRTSRARPLRPGSSAVPQLLLGRVRRVAPLSAAAAAPPRGPGPGRRPSSAMDAPVRSGRRSGGRRTLLRSRNPPSTHSSSVCRPPNAPSSRTCTAARDCGVPVRGPSSYDAQPSSTSRNYVTPARA